MRRRLLTLVAAAALAAGCSGAGDSGGDAGGLEELRTAISADVDCGELFDIRNAAEVELRDAGQMETANAALQEIGCFSSGSTRTDR